MTRRVFGLLLLAVACKEAPIGGSPDASQSSLAGTWQGVQSTEPNGDGGILAVMVLEDAPGGQVRGVLQVSETGAADLGTIGRLAGPAQGGAFVRGPLLPDAGFEARYRMTVTASQSLNHLEIVEQNHQVPDGGPFPVYYRFDRQ